jgi:cytochrome b561
MPASRTRYGTVAIALHWLIALGVIANIAAGLYVSTLPRSDPNQFFIIQTHKSIGLTVLMLSVIRVVWRLINPVPPLPEGMSPVLRVTARTTQFLLYFLILAIPLSGWAWVSSSPLGLPTLYFGLFQWPHISYFADLSRDARKPWSHDFGTVHVFLAWSAIVLVTLHILGALYHQLIRRDDVVARMLPLLGARKSTAANA